MTVNFFEQFKTKAELTEYIKIHCNCTVSDFMSSQLPKEKVFQDAILKALRKWSAEGKIDRNAFIRKNGAAVYQSAGLPDITAVIGGRFFAFEVKRPFIGKVSGIQQKTIDDINASGGVATVVSYVSEVHKIIADAGYWQTQYKPETHCADCEHWGGGVCKLLSCDIGTDGNDYCSLGLRKGG